eukprot:g80892.t1
MSALTLQQECIELNWCATAAGIALGTCRSDGSCICYPEYYGPNCTTLIETGGAISGTALAFIVLFGLCFLPAVAVACFYCYSQKKEDLCAWLRRDRPARAEHNSRGIDDSKGILHSADAALPSSQVGTPQSATSTVKARGSPNRPGEEPVNGDGAPTRLSLDSYHTQRQLHYCGRHVGQSGYANACGRCDGRCGPNNGCQCKACHAMDFPASAASSAQGKPSGAIIAALVAQMKQVMPQLSDEACRQALSEHEWRVSPALEALLNAQLASEPRDTTESLVVEMTEAHHDSKATTNDSKATTVHPDHPSTPMRQRSEMTERAQAEVPGIDVSTVRRALSDNDWNLDAAVSKLKNQQHQASGADSAS